MKIKIITEYKKKANTIHLQMQYEIDELDLDHQRSCDDCCRCSCCRIQKDTLKFIFILFGTLLAFISGIFGAQEIKNGLNVYSTDCQLGMNIASGVFFILAFSVNMCTKPSKDDFDKNLNVLKNQYKKTHDIINPPPQGGHTIMTTAYKS